MVGDARLLILLPLETRQVAPDNTVVLTLKLGNQTLSRLTRLIIVVSTMSTIGTFSNNQSISVETPISIQAKPYV